MHKDSWVYLVTTVVTLECGNVPVVFCMDMKHKGNLKIWPATNDAKLHLSKCEPVDIEQ